MLISYNWLQRYFETKLPSPEELAEKLVFHSFEIEKVEGKNDDSVLDIKVLPDRAHDCLCHYGIAKEISALFGLEIGLRAPRSTISEAVATKTEKTNRDLKIKIEDEKLCRRYIGRVIENLQVKDSSTWLKQSIEIFGQRAINNVVDVSNQVMLDIGQPLHAFDADRVEGNIQVRSARKGEKIVTLDNQEIDLDETVLIIADNKYPLAIAGIKGGKKAEVTAETKNLILEAANFDPVNIRKTARKIGIATDASKRFENELSTEVADYAMDLLTDLIVKEAGTAETKVGEKIDVYPTKIVPPTIEFETKEFSERLGVEISVDESIKILESLGIEVELQSPRSSTSDTVKVIPPIERLDLVAKENYVEEVGRIYGYEKIAGKLPSHLEASPLSDLPAEALAKEGAEKRFNLANKIRVILKAEGFNEVYGYSFTDRGEVELANPLANDKKFLRTNLTDWLTEKIKVNLPYILFDNEAVKIFEIGKVFVGGKEETKLGIGIGYRKKIKGQSAKDELEKVARLCEIQSQGSSRLDLAQPADEILAIQEFDFDKLVEETKEISETKLDDLINKNASYKIVSSYPRIIRDVAVWVSETTSVEEVSGLIKKVVSELCVEGPILFDEFTKEGRKSLAFRLVFQSYVKTLSDDEANAEMDKVIETLEKQAGFEVRK